MTEATDQKQRERPIGTASYETQQLADRLKKAAAAESYDVIPYSELSQIIAADVQREGRSYLISARRIVERDTGRLFGVVLDRGVKLLEINEQAALGTDYVMRTKRLTRRAVTRLAHAQTEKMSADQLREHHTNASILGAMGLFMRPKSIAKIEDAVDKCSAKLAIGETLKLFEQR